MGSTAEQIRQVEKKSVNLIRTREIIQSKQQKEKGLKKNKAESQGTITKDFVIEVLQEN